MATQTSNSSQSGTSSNVTELDNSNGAADQVSSGVVRLKLNKPEPRKKVSWTNDTVDNEHLGRKKSKCCCVYVAPKAFDESSSDDSDQECEHCYGHTENNRQDSSSNLPADGDSAKQTNQ